MRLIDADEVKKVIEDSVSQYGGQYSADMLNMWALFSHIIDDAPTVKTFTLEDIEEQYRKGLEKGLSEWETERPQGEWILNKDENPECPFCHHNFTYWGNFCGNCGADMRKEAR